MKLVLMGLCAVVLSGCVGSFEEAKLAGANLRTPAVQLTAAPVPSEYCQSLDSEQMWATGVAVGLGSVGLAGGLTSLALEQKNDDVRTGLQVGAAVSAAGSVTAAMVANRKGARWVEQCGQ